MTVQNVRVPADLLSDEERREFEALYRQQISSVRTLARLLGYPCPLKPSREELREERRGSPTRRRLDDRDTLLGD